jgi:hypothetical protein
MLDSDKQNSYPEITVDQDSVVSSNDEYRITLVQPRASGLSQDNESNTDEPQITPAQPPSLSLLLFSFPSI